jgi:hypothetical protein
MQEKYGIGGRLENHIKRFSDHEVHSSFHSIRISESEAKLREHRDTT